MNILKEKKYLGMVGAVLVIIGLFLPFVSVSVSFLGVSNSQSTSWIGSGEFGAILTLILSVITLLVIFSDKLADKVAFFEKLKNQKITLIPTVISALLLIFSITQVSSVSGLAGAFGGSISLGFGFWLIVIGLVACVAYPFLYKGEN